MSCSWFGFLSNVCGAMSPSWVVFSHASIEKLPGRRILFVRYRDIPFAKFLDRAWKIDVHSFARRTAPGVVLSNHGAGGVIVPRGFGRLGSSPLLCPGRFPQRALDAALDCLRRRFTSSSLSDGYDQTMRTGPSQRQRSLLRETSALVTRASCCHLRSPHSEQSAILPPFSCPAQ